MSVRVAIVSWNTRALLAAGLDALRDEGCEVVVVDNGSADGSPEEVRARPWARLLEPGANLGFGAAVNLGLAGATTEFVVAANADTAVMPGALPALVAAARRDRRIGVVAPRLVLPDGTTQDSLHPFPALGVMARHAAGLPVAREEWAYGAFLLLRREAWEAVGGFDASIWMYAEDLDLCWRLRRAGWHLAAEPRAAVRHHASAATAQAWGEERGARAQAAAYAWLARRRGAPYARAVATVAWAGASARARLAREPWRRQWAGTWAAWHRQGMRVR